MFLAAGDARDSFAYHDTPAGELELELILTHMTQKSMLRVGAGFRANCARTKKQGPYNAAATRQTILFSVVSPIKYAPVGAIPIAELKSVS